jgi:beta-galactosidase
MFYVRNTLEEDFKGTINVKFSRDYVDLVSTTKDIDILKNNTRLSKFIMHIDKPELWTPETPHIWNLDIQIGNKSWNPIEIHDICGIREVKFEKDQFFLNGKPYKLIGYNFEIDQADFGFVIPPTLIIDKLQRLKEIKINAIRSNQGMLNPFIIEWASRLGYLVIQDLPLTELTLGERDHFLKILIDNIRAQPALICYSTQTKVNLKDPQNNKLLQNLRQLILTKLDATRLYLETGYLGAQSWIENDAEGFKDILK